MDRQILRIPVQGSGTVSARLDGAVTATTCFVFAHGAGAGMDHPFMQAIAEGLAARDITVLRFQFPFMENGSKRPDAPAVAQAAIRSAVSYARQILPGAALIAGGKSFGGRLTSQVQALEPLERVRGLAFLGFPLHPASKPSIERAAHLAGVKVPMLFLQGTNDKLAEVHLLQRVVAGLGSRARLALLPNADHSFHVPVRSGITHTQVVMDLLNTFVSWSERSVTSKLIAKD